MVGLEAVLALAAVLALQRAQELKPFVNTYQNMYPKLVQSLRKYLNMVTTTVRISKKPSI